MKTAFALLIASLGHFLNGACSAQEGGWDVSFDPGTGTTAPFYPIHCALLQSDNKIVVAGQFSSFNGQACQPVCRLNTDGSLDPTFTPPAIYGLTESVLSSVVQPDDKIILVGHFTDPYDHLLRLNADGSLDPAFNPGSGVFGGLLTVALEPNGKVLIGGNFTYYDGTAVSDVARVNADGTLDVSFLGAGTNGQVFSLAVQADGAVVIGGSFTTVGGVSRNGVARLMANGSLDASFDPGLGFEGGAVQVVTILPDGRIMVGGLFDSVNGSTRYCLARLNVDGTLDNAFNADANVLSNDFDEVYDVASQPDGKLIVVGNFGVRIARLEANGIVDPSFDPGDGAGGTSSIGVYEALVQPDGKILIGGGFAEYDNIEVNGIARLNGPATGLVELMSPQVRVYPNPTTGQCVLRSEGHDVPESIEVLDMAGRRLALWNPRAEGMMVDLNLTDLPEGLYTVNAFFGEGTSATTMLAKTGAWH